MHDPAVRIGLFLVVCLAVGLVSGATRATSLSGVTRESLKHFVGLAGGIALLVVALSLLEWVVRG